MLFLCLIIAITAQELPSNALDDYSNLNPRTVKEAIQRGSTYMTCMTYIHYAVTSCVTIAGGRLNAFGVRQWGEFQSPNKCLVSLSVTYCGDLSTLERVHRELRTRHFSVTYGLMTNSNLTFAQLQGLNLMPTSMTIAW